MQRATRYYHRRRGLISVGIAIYCEGTIFEMSDGFESLAITRVINRAFGERVGDFFLIWLL